ncbi:hypothetical protein JCM6882_002390 [Rhodosporidiobolus microsporus]
MLDKLPHDLVLYLADFVVPLPTAANLVERRGICEALSLLHPTWTAVGQAKLFEHLPVTLPTDPERLAQRLEAARRNRPQINSLEVTGPGDVGYVREPIDELVRSCGRVRHLILKRFPDFPLLWSTVPELQSLSFDGRIDNLHFASLVSLATLPSTLTRLSLTHVRLASAPPSLPHIHTLILCRSSLDKTADCFPFFSSFPSLRTLAWDESAPTPSASFFTHAPPTLRHVLLGIPTALHYGLEESALTALEDKPPLKSLTFRGSAPPDLAVMDKFEQVKARCLERGTRFVPIVAQPDWFDLERWSLSVF